MSRSAFVQEILTRHAAAVRQQRGRAIRTGGVEAVHQLRVATRRLEETLGFLEPFLPRRPVKRLRRRARKIRRSLGPLRNADVLAKLVGDLRAGLPEERRASLEPLAARLEAEADALRRRARQKKGLRVSKISKRIEALRRCLPANLAIPIADRGEALVASRLREIREAMPAARRGGAAPLHELRIRIKRYRYGLEILDLAGMKTARPAIERARVLQTALGKLHDVDVLIDLVRGSGPPSHPFVQETLRGRRLERLRDVAKLLKGFDLFLAQRTAA